MDPIPKPDELLALHDVTAELFDTLRRWFDVPTHPPLDLEDIHSAVTERGDPVMIAALAMRKLQALRLLSTPGVKTSTDVVVSIVQDVDRALASAPTLRLHVAARQTDWDAAFANLVDEGATDQPADEDAPAAADAEDPEAVRFRELHRRLHEAAASVLRASDGEIRYLQ
jgi:hypothetical protein